jgi:hypothetical protein
MIRYYSQPHIGPVAVVFPDQLPFSQLFPVLFGCLNAAFGIIDDDGQLLVAVLLSGPNHPFSEFCENRSEFIDIDKNLLFESE